MRILVGYISQSGNTKKVAEAIYSQIEAEKEIKSLDQIDSLDGWDLAFIGFPVHGFGPNNDARAFLDQHSAGKKLALFVTHAVPEDREELQAWLEKCREPAAAANVVGFFNCQGELAEPVAEILKQSADPKMVEYGESRPLTLGQPDETRLERARAFTRQVMGK